MRKLGKTLHVSQATGNVIVKASVNPKIGEKVFDGDLKLVGSVFDVFGPVTSPYVSVKPVQPLPKGYEKTLFLSDQKKERKRKGERLKSV
ncbi:Gar1/Naf1 family protein [Candidatus Hecatella orcuttiae]|uniref:H/ACA ribonucleoprotein complex subunit GAR1 n=1 Tax=Candidatus Hecatella orcuttiae TaxID=1935119 RepID=UPI0028683666|nr:Gar1/Naf1 family protein [Candidatus Hecatella orcuttiae]